MKSVCIALVFAVIAGAIPLEHEIFENIQNIAENAMKKGERDLESIVNLVKDLTVGTKSQANDIISIAQKDINILLAQLESQISNLFNNKQISAACVQKKMRDLSNLKNTFGKNVENCSGQLADNISIFEKQVLVDVAELKSSVGELGTVAQKCATDILQAISCTVTKAKTIDDIINNAVSAARTAIHAAENQAMQMITTIHACVQKIRGDALNEIANVNTDVNECT